MVSSHHELMPIAADQLHIPEHSEQHLIQVLRKCLHGIRTLTATIDLLSCVHGSVCSTHPQFCNKNKKIVEQL